LIVLLLLLHLIIVHSGLSVRLAYSGRSVFINRRPSRVDV